MFSGSVKSEGLKGSDSVKRRTAHASRATAFFVVAVALAMACMLWGCGQHQENPSSSERQGAQSSSSEIASQSRAELDLDDSADHETVNLFLSNFSEALPWSSDPLVTSEASAADFAQFAVRHCGLNNKSSWERPDGSGANTYSGIPGEGGGPLGVYNARIDAKLVEETVDKYFGVPLDLEELAEPDSGRYRYQDGYIYFGTTAPLSPLGVCVAHELTNVGEGSYEVRFDVYSAPVGYYDVGNEALYTSSPGEVAAILGADGPFASGFARFHMRSESGVEDKPVLDSYETTLKNTVAAADVSSSSSAGDAGVSDAVSEPDAGEGEDDDEASAPAFEADGEEDAAADFEERLESIDADKAEDKRMGGTTAEMIEAGNEYSARYEELMDDVYAYLSDLPSIDGDALEAAQLEWESETEQAVADAAAANGGGSLVAVDMLDVRMRSQESRILELIAMISD